MRFLMRFNALDCVLMRWVAFFVLGCVKTQLIRRKLNCQSSASYRQIKKSLRCNSFSDFCTIRASNVQVTCKQQATKTSDSTAGNLPAVFLCAFCVFYIYPCIYLCALCGVDFMYTMVYNEYIKNSTTHHTTGGQNND